MSQSSRRPTSISPLDWPRSVQSTCRIHTTLYGYIRDQTMLFLHTLAVGATDISGVSVAARIAAQHGRVSTASRLNRACILGRARREDRQEGAKAEQPAARHRHYKCHPAGVSQRRKKTLYTVHSTDNAQRSASRDACGPGLSTSTKVDSTVINQQHHLHPAAA